MKFAFVFTLLASAQAFSVSRRDLIQQTAAVATIAVASPALALDSCPKGSKNCIVTEWTPPADAAKKDIAATIRSVLSEYPQEGQSEVDLGGYTIVADDLDNSGVAKVEYKSGIGKFAKFFNGGKPFVDDLTVEIVSEGKVVTKSASRVGDSDFDVNRKRLSYLATSLRKSGWTVPEPKY